MFNLGNDLVEAAKKFSDETFLMYMENDELQRISYSSFLDKIKHWAYWLQAQGITAGDRVAIITPKSPMQTLSFYACWWSGIIAVPICEDLGDMEMGFIIRDCEPNIVLSDNSRYDKVVDNAADIPVIKFEDIPSITNLKKIENFYDLEDDDVAALIYTSGSTGMPKGVMLTHKNFHRNANSALELFDITPNDRVISLLPYWHSFAMVVEILLPIYSGATVVIAKNRRDFKKNLSIYQPTIMLVVPRIADALKGGIQKKINNAPEKNQKIFNKAIDNASRIFTIGPKLDGGLLRLTTHHAFYDPMVFRKIRKGFGGKLKFFISGGAPLDMEHQIFFKYIGVPMYQGYGMTESTPVITVNNEEHNRLGSTGPFMSWVFPENGGDWTFKDDKGNCGKELQGELLVKGDCVMKGYWRHTDKSAKTLADGWLHTGDMGYADNDGYLFLNGRQGNMIVLFGGEKVHPEHVEDVIKSDELITEAIVIGEKCKNVYACVNVDAELAEKYSADELQKEVLKRIKARSSHLAAYQKPKSVLILPDFSVDDNTLTVTLKVRRHKIWDLYHETINKFLLDNGEELATSKKVNIASSKIMESLGN